jgi:sec-independent protein translocase protein TatB
MDSFFGIGFAELMVILVLAGLVMGPHRIREVARTLGRWTAQLQGISREFARQLNSELDSLDDDGQMKATMKEMRDLQREVKSLREEMSQVPRAFIQESKESVQDLVDEGKAALDGRKTTYKPVSRPPEERENGSAQPNTPNPLPKPLDIPEDQE